MALLITRNITELLAIAGFALGLICSLYLFYVWLRYHREQIHILFWSVALALFYVFLIPFIWVNLGETIVLAKWTNFFISTIPVIFLGWAFIYWGIVRVKSNLSQRQLIRFSLLLSFWVLLSFIFYSIRFSLVKYGHLLSVAGIVLFFITINILILFALWDWFKRLRQQGSMREKTGVIFITSAIIVSIARYLIILNDLVTLPHVFWFLSVASFDIVFILRSVVIILLAIGFILAHKHRFFEEGV